MVPGLIFVGSGGGLAICCKESLVSRVDDVVLVSGSCWVQLSYAGKMCTVLYDILSREYFWIVVG